MESNESREMRITRGFDAPVELLWEVWTNPQHIVNWWGPNGFTSTIRQMDVQVGGEWKLNLLSPDGTNYPNRSVYMEIVPLEKIVFEHFNPHFITTVIFRPDGTGTFMTWSMLFDTAELRDVVVNVHKADKGLEENVEKLEKYLSGLHSD